MASLFLFLGFCPCIENKSVMGWLGIALET